MITVKELTVSLDLAVQPKQYQSIKMGISATVNETEDGKELNIGDVNLIRTSLSKLLRQGIYEETKLVFGEAVASYVVDQSKVS